MSAFDTLNALPEAITSGETIVWEESHPDYAQGSYTIAYNFAGNTPIDGYESFQVSGSGSGTTWTFTITAASAPKPGIYGWQQIVTRVSPAGAAQLASGTLVIRPNLATAQTSSAAATMLAALETAITTLTAGTSQSVSFNGQSVTKKDMTRLLSDRENLRAEVIREQDELAALNGMGKDRNIVTVFQ